uniref:Nuclear receptor subfamily 2 group E member 1 n=1 Tax=Timema cristinae TaxID=61476 RepID=A0A7R9CUV7_TIMCR|nr:unnamed protein product [Timema cristinae]
MINICPQEIGSWTSHVRCVVTEAQANITVSTVVTVSTSQTEDVIRCIHRNRVYTCKAAGDLKGRCPIDKTHRNQCRACRLNKCFQAAMNKDDVRNDKKQSNLRTNHPISVRMLCRARSEQTATLSVVRRFVITRQSVQHERGPRKPKHGPLLGGGKDSHHPHGLLLPPPHGDNTLVFPGPGVKPPPPSLDQQPPPPPPPHPHMFLAASSHHPPPPPGLLQLLMSAEKCQEFIWSAKLNDAERLTPGGVPQPSPSLPLTLTPTWEVLQQPKSPSHDTDLLTGEPFHWTELHFWSVVIGLQETTARLLFMAVRWVRCLAPFQTLSKRDQLLLLQESWKELFLIHLAQWSIPWDLSAVFGCSKARDRLPQDDVTNNEIKTIQVDTEIMGRFRQLSPDGSECGCMKAVILFTPGMILYSKSQARPGSHPTVWKLRVSETAGLCDVQPVEMLQDQAQCILGDYVRSRYPRQPTRFGRLLLLVPSLRAVRQSTVEQLFFKETIGEIPIQRLLGDMYHMEKYA